MSAGMQSSLFQHQHATHPGTPTKKHRLVDENQTPSRTTPRRPLQSVSENDMNIRSSHKDIKEPHVKAAKSTFGIGSSSSGIRTSTYFSTFPQQPQQQLPVDRLTNAVSSLHQKSLNNKLQVQSAFYQWLTFTLRSQLAAKNAFNTPKKRRMSEVPSNHTTPLNLGPSTPTGNDRHAHSPSIINTAERTYKSRSVNDSGKSPAFVAQTLADKLRQLDEVQPGEHSNPSSGKSTFSAPIAPQQYTERRHHVHVDREKLYDHGRDREAPAFHANVDFNSLHKAMRDMTQSSVLTLSRVKNRQQSVLENNCSTFTVREIAARMDYHLGITETSSDQEVSNFIQNYGYVKPSANPPLPLSGSGQETTSSGVALIELPHLRDKFSEWKTRYNMGVTRPGPLLSSGSTNMEEE